MDEAKVFTISRIGARYAIATTSADGKKSVTIVRGSELFDRMEEITTTANARGDAALFEID